MSNIIQIDRTRPFDPEEFLGDGWSIVEQDERALALTEIDLDQVQLVSMLQTGENRITAEERQARLKEAGFIPLDAAVFWYLWQHQDKIPGQWKTQKAVFCDGTILLHPDVASRCVLFLFWLAGAWCCGFIRLFSIRDHSDPSAVLPVQQ